MAPNSQIPWRRLCVEGAAIVVSILLAFWIDAWWSEREDKNEERALLVALGSDLRKLNIEIREVRVYVAALNKIVQQLISLSTSADIEIRDAELDDLLSQSMYNVSAWNLHTPVLSSLFSAGELDKISNGDLRRALSRFMFNLNGMRETVVRDSNYYDATKVLFFQQNSSMAQLYSIETHDPGFPDRIYPPVFPVTLVTKMSHREMLKSRAFQNVMLHRITTLTNILMWPESELEDLSEEIIALVDSELHD